MKIIQSLWAVPNYTPGWLTKKDFFYSQLISSGYAKKTFGNVHLIADTESADLIKEVGIEYDSISTDLDSLKIDKRWWVAGKIKAYSLQTEPFLHIDGDAYLWNALPGACQNAPLLAQEFEKYGNWPTFYEVYDTSREAAEKILKELPDAWNYTKDRVAVNAGIFGGTRIDIIKKYTDYVLNVMSDTDYAERFSELPVWETSVFFEQQLAYCFAALHGEKITCLVDHLDKNQTIYSHAMGAKKNRFVAERMALRASREFPKQFEAINALYGDAKPKTLLGFDSPETAVRWTAFHKAALDPEITNQAFITAARSLADNFKASCSCQTHWNVIISRHPFDLTWNIGQRFQWSVDTHNAVNVSMKKPLVSYEQAAALHSV